ncbi:unnamed protein product [Cyclocybe aegerita]|uniref:Uncharacterized protein n=1 Tax=Cyclocybe aegerita TaxID=1973307 RepID=A0A8S0X210_CYCAE|nr:unnamed protein product [Cyclocybe aegerita]
MSPVAFDTSSSSNLKPWLVRTLEPICDAEPGALADYILALLKHNVPESEMRQELAVQLDEFLEKECSSFIDTLFTVLRTKSYMSYASESSTAAFPTKPLDNGIPIPLEGLLGGSPSERSRKRNNSGDDRDGRPTKGQRLNDGQFSRNSIGGGDGRMGQGSGNWNRLQYRDGGMGMNMGVGGFGMPMNAMGMNGMAPMNGRRPQGYQPPDQKRGICRDYHNNGYCARGAMCKYSHGDDAVVPGQLFSGAQGMPFMPMFPPNGMPFMPGAAYDPHERMDMRPMNRQRAPLLPRVQQEDGSRVMHPIHASGELPVIQDLTPNVPPDIPRAEPVPQVDVDMQQLNMPIPPQNLPSFNPMLAMNGMNSNPYQPINAPMEVDSNVPPAPRPPSGGRGGFRGGRGGGRGTFGGEVHKFRPEKRNDKTLVVEKIPEDKLSLEQVNEWFKKFGTVTNVAIDAMGGKALVSFSDHEEAHAAWKSEDAVFGNRFVKVFWHRPMEGHGQVGARMLAASAPLVANMGNKSSSNTPQPPPTTGPSTSAASSSTAAPSTATSAPRKASSTPTASAALSALAEKQRRLESMITEQKSLMASLSTASADEKKVIMAKLRKLNEDMTSLNTSTPTPVTTPSITLKKPEEAERERLDNELEMHSGPAEQEARGTTEELNAKLERLKAEAASLGLDSSLPSSSAPYRGGYRGRGRGAPRGYFRGAMRGGPPRASMKLDNRPKKLLVKGVSEENLQGLRDWYETTGQLESVEPTEGGAYIVSFRSRSAAEQGLSKGSNIPLIGAVQISWYTGKVSATTSTTTKASKPQAANGDTSVPVSNPESEVGGSPEIHLSHLQEEEVVASGWGGDDEGDGMGML